MVRGKRGEVFEKVCKLRRENPYLSAAEIARTVGRSRERVRQILIAAGFPTSPILDSRYRCKVCGKLRKRPLKRGFCISCSPFPRWITFSCPVCGKNFSRRYVHIKYQMTKRGYKNFFCSHACFGKWLGITFGFGVRQNRGERTIARRITLACERCGKEIQRTEREIGRFSHHFCSRRCTMLWLRDRHFQRKRREEI